jgi:hypothetical protein
MIRLEKERWINVFFWIVRAVAVLALLLVAGAALLLAFSLLTVIF